MCAATYSTFSNTHSNTLGLSLLRAAWSWNLAFPGHARHICWTNKNYGRSVSFVVWDKSKKHKKWLTVALKAKPLQLFAAHWKCGVSRVDLKTPTITQIIACSLCPPQFFPIMLSWSKHSLPTTKPARLKNRRVYPRGICGRGWFQTDGTSGRDRWSPTEVICSLWN